MLMDQPDLTNPSWRLLSGESKIVAIGLAHLIQQSYSIFTSVLLLHFAGREPKIQSW